VSGRRQLEQWLTEPETEPQYLREALFVKLLLLRRLAKGNLDILLARQRRVYLQRLRDLAELEKQARQEGRNDLVLLIKGAVIHTEADIKWMDVYLEEITSLESDPGGKS